MADKCQPLKNDKYSICWFPIMQHFGYPNPNFGNESKIRKAFFRLSEWPASGKNQGIRNWQETGHPDKEWFGEVLQESLRCCIFFSRVDYFIFVYQKLLTAHALDLFNESYLGALCMFLNFYKKKQRYQISNRAFYLLKESYLGAFCEFPKFFVKARMPKFVDVRFYKDCRKVCKLYVN